MASRPYAGPNRRRNADTDAVRERRARLQAQWDAHEVKPTQERRTAGTATDEGRLIAGRWPADVQR